MSLLSLYRRQLLDAAGLMFLFGVVVGFLSPLYIAIERLAFIHVFLTGALAFIFEIAAYFSAAILCLISYMNLKGEKLRTASARGVIAAGLFVLTGTWLASLLVLGAAIICSLCQTR